LSRGLAIRYSVIIILATGIVLVLGGCRLVSDLAPLPTVGISTTPSGGVAPLHVQLAAVFARPVEQAQLLYDWDLGDGTELAGRSIVHTYSEPGQYTVSLTVTDGQGEESNCQIVIQVSKNPEEGENLRDLIGFGDHVLFWHDGHACIRVAEAVWVHPDILRVEMLKDTHELIDEELTLGKGRFTILSAGQEEELSQVPANYYGVDIPPPVRTDLQELVDALDAFRFPQRYIPEVYEATHMAAYLEVVLENLGFDAWIAIGPNPVPRCDGMHSWVLVNVGGTTVAIEPMDSSLIAPESALIFDSHPSICPYYIGEGLEIYHDIYVLAAMRSVDGFEWWKVAQ